MKSNDIYLKFQKSKDYILKHEFLLALSIVVAFIAIGVFFGRYNNSVVPVATNPIARYLAEPNNPLSFMSNWDGPDYIQIAKHSYVALSSANFFPLYPILIHLVNAVLSSAVDSALLISWVFFVGAAYFYLKILKLIFDLNNNRAAVKGLLLFILFPTAVFLFATYTESLFAFLSLGAIYSALRSKYLAAGFFTLFATATHDNGVFILLLIGLILWEQKVKFTKILSALVIGCLGIVSYMLYLSIKFHNAFGFITAQKSHGWLAHGYINNLKNSVDLFNLLFIGLIILSIIYWWKRRKSFSIYSGLFLLIPLIGGQFGGFNRYVLMVFPIQFMLFDKFRKKTIAYPLLIAATAICWTYFLFQYTGGYIGG